MTLRHKIYLAGKITKNCWRHALVAELRASSWRDAPLDCGGYLYVGPFFAGCDHGCYHGPTTHGNLNAYDLCMSLGTNRGQVRTACLKAIDDCDIFVAYIDEHQCYGTIAETQYAQSEGKYIVIAFSPEIASPSRNEFWFVTIAAHQVKYNISEADLPSLLSDIFGSV